MCIIYSQINSWHGYINIWLISLSAFSAGSLISFPLVSKTFHARSRDPTLCWHVIFVALTFSMRNVHLTNHIDYRLLAHLTFCSVGRRSIRQTMEGTKESNRHSWTSTIHSVDNQTMFIASVGPYQLRSKSIGASVNCEMPSCGQPYI